MVAIRFTFPTPRMSCCSSLVAKIVERDKHENVQDEERTPDRNCDGEGGRINLETTRITTTNSVGMVVMKTVVWARAEWTGYIASWVARVITWERKMTQTTL